MKLITPGTASIESISIQMPDSLVKEMLRELPIINHFVPPNTRPIITIPGRQRWSNIVIESDDDVELGKTYEHEFDGRTHSFMPFIQRGNRFECAVNFVKAKN